MGNRVIFILNVVDMVICLSRRQRHSRADTPLRVLNLARRSGIESSYITPAPVHIMDCTFEMKKKTIAAVTDGCTRGVFGFAEDVDLIFVARIIEFKEQGKPLVLVAVLPYGGRRHDPSRRHTRWSVCPVCAFLFRGDNLGIKCPEVSAAQHPK